MLTTLKAAAWVCVTLGGLFFLEWARLVLDGLAKG